MTSSPGFRWWMTADKGRGGDKTLGCGSNRGPPVRCRFSVTGLCHWQAGAVGDRSMREWAAPAPAEREARLANDGTGASSRAFRGRGWPSSVRRSRHILNAAARPPPAGWRWRRRRTTAESAAGRQSESPFAENGTARRSRGRPASLHQTWRRNRGSGPDWPWRRYFAPLAIRKGAYF